MGAFILLNIYWDTCRFSSTILLVHYLFMTQFLFITYLIIQKSLTPAIVDGLLNYCFRILHIILNRSLVFYVVVEVSSLTR